MKIKIHHSYLKTALNIIEKSLSSKSVIESLKGIKIIATDNEITFLTSKSEMAIKYSIQTDDKDIIVFEKGEAIIPGHHFINITRRIKANYINFEVEKNMVHINAGKSHVNLILFNNDSYPQISFDIKAKSSITINKSILTTTFNKTKYAISSNPINPILTGINYNFTGEELKVYTTDSLRMIFLRDEIKTEVPVSFTIIKHLIQDINKVLEYVDEDMITLSINDGQCIIKTNNLEIKVRLLDGVFPNVEKIIPKDSNFGYLVNKEELLESLQRAVLLTERDESVVIAQVTGNTLSLKSSHKYLGTIEEECQISILNGSSFDIAFDPYFVIDSLHAIESEEVHLGFIDEVSGFIVKEKDGDNIINMISPIRIN